MELEIVPAPTDEERRAIEQALEDEAEQLPPAYESAWRRAASDDRARKIAGAPRA